MHTLKYDPSGPNDPILLGHVVTQRGRLLDSNSALALGSM